MSTYAFDEHVRIWWATSIADKTAPTVTELGSAIELTTVVTKSGLKFGVTNNVVDNGNISTSFKAERPGTWQAKPTLECQNDDGAGTDIAHDALGTRLVEGFVIVRKGPVFTQAVAAGDSVSVNPVQTMQPKPNDSAENALVTTMYEFAAISEPVDATVAA